LLLSVWLPAVARCPGGEEGAGKPQTDLAPGDAGEKRPQRSSMGEVGADAGGAGGRRTVGGGGSRKPSVSSGGGGPDLRQKEEQTR